jgi:L-2-hydroxycarboxylate dehydrogenase (NAD+)
MNTYAFDVLQTFVKQVFRRAGMSEKHAADAAIVLLAADLRGIDSHGIARLSGYMRLVDKKRINPNPRLRIIHESLSTATVDADAAIGLVAAPYAMEIAIEKAQTAGTGWVAVKNSNHFGIAGHHAMLALKHNMIGIAMTNASPLVAPTFSTSRMLGTNPMAFAIPSASEPPIVADFATTTAANGKLEILQRKSHSAPEGWIQDKDGNSSVNPHELANGGALLPLGGDREHGSHKGYCLGAVVDIFSAVLSGANYGPWVPPFVAFLDPPANPVGEGIGHFFGAMRIDAFRPAEDFLKHADNWIRAFRNANRTSPEQPVIIPGDPERECELLRRENGIPLHPAVENDLQKLGEAMGIRFGH